MVKYTIKIDGMRCPKCEARVNNALKENFETKNVKVSKDDKQAVVIANNELDEAKIKEVIDDTGFTFVSITKEPYTKKGLFGF